jgi:hypothetical protein
MTFRIEPQQRIEKVYPWTDEAWLASAAQQTGMISETIAALGGLEQEMTKDLYEAIGEVVIRYPEDFAPFEEHRPPSSWALISMREAIRDWFADVEVREEDETYIVQQIPLCVFDAPAFPGAKTTYGEAKSRGSTVGWKIEMLGSGFGADQKVVVKHESEFTASAGTKKLVFAPLNVRIVRASLYKRGKYQRSFLKAELAESDVRDANGIRTVSDAEWQAVASRATLRERFDLSGDASWDVVKYKRTYTMAESIESKLGLKAFNLDTTITAKCEAEHTAEVTFELPAGRVYELWKPSSVLGFVFAPVNNSSP